MWQTLLLYQENPIFAWLPVETIVAHHQQEYYRAIRRSTHHNDSGIFAQFMLLALKQATAEFREKYLRGEIKDNVGVSVGANVGVKDEILKFLSANPNIRAKKIAALLNKTPRTIERNLKLLKEQGIIVRVGSDKSGYWQINNSCINIL